MNLLKGLELSGIDAIHSINTVPFGMMYPDKFRLWQKVGGGGVSGKPHILVGL